MGRPASFTHTCTHSYMHALIHARTHTCTHSNMHARIHARLGHVTQAVGGMASRLVESTSVERTSFHVARPRWAHTYAVPYLAVYVVILAVAAWAKYGVTSSPETALAGTPTAAAAPGDVDAAVFLALNASTDVDASDDVAALDISALANDSVVVTDADASPLLDGEATPGAEAATQEPAVALPARREPKRVLDDDEEPWDPNTDVFEPVPSTAPAPTPTPAAEPTPAPEPAKPAAAAAPEPTPNRAAWTVDEATIFALVLAAIGQALAFLACHWSVNVRAAFTCSTVRTGIAPIPQGGGPHLFCWRAYGTGPGDRPVQSRVHQGHARRAPRRRRAVPAPAQPGSWPTCPDAPDAVYTG